MATNADDVVDDDKEVTADDLRNLKYTSTNVETSNEEDETEEEDETKDDSESTGEEDETNSDDQTEETDETDEESDDSEFVKKFPHIKGDSLEDYARNLEAAYDNSTAEFQRLRQTEKPKDDGNKDETKVDTSDPISLYMKQKMDEEITTAFGEFSKHYPQVNDQGEYAKFTQEVSTLSQTILQSQKRMAPPKELYSKAAVILGWEPEGKVDGKDKLGIALKNKAAISKNPASATKKTSKSKVTDAMIAANRLMYPDKTDAQIREELEPYVQ